MQFTGVVHLLPLPGSPRAVGLDRVLDAARADAGALLEGGCDQLIVENFGDVPFLAGRVEPVTVAAMTRAVEAVVAQAGGARVGVNVLRNDAAAALSIAHACGAGFVRVNVHVGAMVTDQGVVEGRAAETLRLRDRLGAEVAIWADVGVKHARPLGAWADVESEARDALLRGLADAVIVTGATTGAPTDPERLAAVRAAVGDGATVIVGSGVTPDAVDGLRGRADGVIVGTWLKRGGRVHEPVDEARVRTLRAALDGVRPGTEG